MVERGVIAGSPELAGETPALPGLRSVMLEGICGTHRSILDAEEFPDLTKHLDEPVYFIGRVIEIKAGSGGGFHAEFAHERLVAMMPAAQGDAPLVRDRDHVMGMNVSQQETDQPGATHMGPEQPDPVVQPG
jgi:hypothetical protein